MYSGGLDSLGCLYVLLTDNCYSDFDVHVHHMHLLNKEGRAEAELVATKATIERLQSMGMRPFLYTESSHDYRFMLRQFVWDMDLCAFMAANTCIADPGIVHVAMGRTKTDVEGASEAFHSRMDRAQRIFDGVWTLESRERPHYIFPVVERTKTDIWRMLPDSLKSCTWSCRRPIYEGNRAIACGRCATCREIQAVHRDELKDRSR